MKNGRRARANARGSRKPAKAISATSGLGIVRPILGRVLVDCSIWKNQRERSIIGPTKGEMSSPHEASATSSISASGGSREQRTKFRGSVVEIRAVNPTERSVGNEFRGICNLVNLESMSPTISLRETYRN